MSQYSATPAANDVSTKLTTTNDTLIQALFIFHSEGEAACVSMFPQYGRAEIIKKLMEICQQSNTGLLSLDNNTGAEMVGNKLLKMNSLNNTLIQALFIFHSEGEEACVSMFPQYGQYRSEKIENKEITIVSAGIIKKLVEICKQSNTGLLSLDNNDFHQEMVGKELLKMNKLELYRNQIVDVTPLATLVNLTKLELYDNQIVDVAPLTTLVNLTWLDLNGNQIVNVAPLAELANLTWLNLNENQIVDVAPLATLVNLTLLSLDMQNFNMKRLIDVAPLAALVNLTSLSLQFNQIVDVAPLAMLINLTKLRLAGNAIADTTPLSSLPRKTKIDGVSVSRSCRDGILNNYEGFKLKPEHIFILVIVLIFVFVIIFTDVRWK